MRQVPFIFISLNDYPPSRGTLSVLYYPMPTLACEKFNLQTWSCSLEVHSIIALCEMDLYYCHAHRNFHENSSNLS